MVAEHRPPPSRVLAFVDILGFSKWVNAAFAEQGNHLEDVIEVLSLIQSQRDLPSTRLPAAFSSADEHSVIVVPPPTRIEVTAFSDSVVLSAELDRTAVTRLVSRVGSLAATLLARGVLTRGGIALGKGLHESGVVVGPAMLDAYELEHCAAGYPRIILSTAAEAALLFDVGAPVAPIRRDVDGFAFVDLVGLLRRKPFAKSALAGVRERLDQEIASGGRPDLIAKLRWLRRQCDQARSTRSEVHGLSNEAKPKLTRKSSQH